jgi:hypothetical protein
VLSSSPTDVFAACGFVTAAPERVVRSPGTLNSFSIAFTLISFVAKTTEFGLTVVGPYRHHLGTYFEVI